MSTGTAMCREAMDASSVTRTEPLRIRRASLEEVDAEAWNKALCTAPEARIQQTVQGAQIRWQMDGQQPYFLSAERGGCQVGQLFLHRGFVHPDVMQWARPLLKSPVLHRIWGVLNWFGGPIIHARDDKAEILRAFLHEVENLIACNGVAAVRNATPAFYGLEVDGPAVDALYGEFGYRQRERATIVLEIDGDEEALWDGLSKEARQKVRKAERQGVEVVQDDTVEGLQRYYAVRLENAHRNGLRPPSRESILAAEPIYMRDGMCKLFLAQCEGEVLAGQMLVAFNGNVQLAGICYSDRARQLRLPVNDMLQWEVIKWALHTGQRRVDWSGYTPQPCTDKEIGINRFKEKWGGGVVNYRVYDKVLAPKRFTALSWLKAQARKFDIR
jgi:hypothetical protein